MSVVLLNPAGGLSALPPLSLYVHIPWCVRKCPYCDFNSHSIKTHLDEMAYVDALLLDLQSELPHIWGRSIETVFIGGGTPSVFSAGAIDRLLSSIRALLKLKPDAEVTLEANPSTFEREKFKGFREAGINRLSIGVQSFDDVKLHNIGRIHNGKEAIQAIQCALNIFERVNVDLMYALPHQTATQAREDVQTAIDLGVKHISAYHLTLEPNTQFAHAPPRGLPDDESALDIEHAVHECLQQAGFTQYETSAFAKDKTHQAQHNLNYWQFGDYVGIGAGAHGKISNHAHIYRTVRKKHPNEYLQLLNHQQFDSLIERNPIAQQDLVGEFMMNALRLHEGVPSAFLPERTGIHASSIQHAIGKACQAGLLDKNPLRYQATALGRRFLNDLIQYFL